MRIVFAVIGFILVIVLSYLLGAYVAWDWNPGNWDGLGRLILGIVSLPLAVVVALTFYCEVKK